MFKQGNTELINERGELWDLGLLIDILGKVKNYTDEKGRKDVLVISIEDNTFSDPVNERYDIWIRYAPQKDGACYIEQQLWILKGELIDGKTFYERHDEFYPTHDA